jgi:hypothetical protein
MELRPTLVIVLLALGVVTGTGRASERPPGKPAVVEAADARQAWRLAGARQAHREGLELFVVGSPGDPACDFSQIQDAIDAAKANGPGQDLILLASNQSHTGVDLDINAHSVWIAGGYPNCTDIFLPGPATVLDGSGESHSVVNVRGTAGGPHEVILENLTLRGGSPSEGGGGLEIDGANVVTVRRTSIRNNDAANGGGIHLAGSSGAALFLEQSAFVGFNSASGDGGGIFCNGGGEVHLANDTLVTTNSAGDDGGGMFLSNCLLVSRAGGSFRGVLANEANDEGGGIHARNGSTVQLLGGTVAPASVVGNEAQDGGGVFLTGPGSSLTAANAAILDNVASDPSAGHIASGGGVAARDGAAVLVHRTLGASCHTADRCSSISGNSAESAGAIWGRDGTTITVRQTYVEDNTVSNTGAAFHVAFGGSSLTLDGVVLAGNSALFSVVSVTVASSLEMTFVTLTGNDSGLAAAILGGDNPNAILSSVIWEDGEPAYSAPAGSTLADCLIVHESGSILAADPDAQFVTVQDPQLADPPGGDYHLAAGSPAIDYCDGFFTGAGSPDVDFEMRGVDDPAVPDNFPGALWDIGADESGSAPVVLIFADGFESGDTTAWSVTQP